jgi:hypothetical protein
VRSARNPFSDCDPLVLKGNKSQHTAYFSSISRAKKVSCLCLMDERRGHF